MVFNTLTLETFMNVKLFRASDTKGGNWNEYGSGYVRVNFIKECDDSVSDCRGKGQLTFHNELTGAGGINMLIVENLPFHLGIKEPNRLTFKALSQTIGTNGLINMYSMRFESTEDAARLWYQASILQFAAKNANAGNAIAIPSRLSLEGTAARAFLGTNEEDVDRFLVWSKLTQLVANNPGDFSFGAESQNEAKDCDNISEDNRSVDGSVVQTSLEAVSTSSNHSTANKASNKTENEESDDTSSLGSYSDFAMSQDWASSFIKRKEW